MARRIDKQKAIELRLKGWSYSQIKKEIKVSKGTLSSWLKDHPLSPERIIELCNPTQERIEKTRNTKNNKKVKRKEVAFDKVVRDIGVLSAREIFISGFYLYWGEGGKTQDTTVCVTNTNPSVLKFFIRWLSLLGVPRDRLKVRLQLYKDMNVQKAINFWSEELSIPKTQFRNPQIKNSSLAGLTYKNGFGKGTCTVIYENRDMAEYVLSGITSFTKQLQVHVPGLEPGT